MKDTYQFMANFTLPEVLTEEFIGLIPYQRAVVNRFLTEGKMLNYALSLEHSKLWAIFCARSEMEVLDMLADMPLTGFMEVEVSMLTFYNTLPEEIPVFSMN
jgi:muconolactone delta-isomerase